METENEYFLRLQEVKKNDVDVLLKKAYRGIWETAIKKYSDSAHFVYELLQNADDTKATWVEFTIEDEGLWYKHNGSVRFTISDPDKEDEDFESGKLGHINAITSIGNSNKIDEQKIGKFGIGFKAVFAYSQTPHIYDDVFNFKLENYIVPIEIHANTQRRKQGETLFYFPFDHTAKSKEIAYTEIEEKLESLFQPILFLTNLQKIKWVSSGKKGEYTKKQLSSETFQKIQAELVEVASVENGVTKNEYLWLFSSDIIHETLKSSHRIKVGFFVINQEELETGYQYEAFCFFPTKEETKLGFFIQAPFLLTDSREGIKAGEQWNVEIMQLVANLAADSLPILKEIGIRDKTFLVNDSILDLIPYKESDFSEITNKTKISFKPFYNTILQKFKTEQLLPGRDGKYFATAKSYWASDPELAELFSDQQISALMENPNSGWVFVSKGQKQLNQANKPLEAYISSIVNDILDPKKLLRRVTAKFIEAQSDEWLLKFYTYLGARKYLWDDKDKIALKRPILLNQDRKAITPFNEEKNIQNIFLPTGRVTSYDTIYKPLVEDIKVLDFIKGLGIIEPDLRAEIFKTIIPQYTDDFDYNDSDLVLLHFESFLTYFETYPAGNLLELINKLEGIFHVAARNLTTPETRIFCNPKQVYFKDKKLTTFFKYTSEVYFLDEDFYLSLINESRKDNLAIFFARLGVSSIPRIKKIKLNATEENKKQFSLGLYKISKTYPYDQTINDKILDGLECAIENITLELSLIIWDYLLDHIDRKTVSEINNFFAGRFNFIPVWGKHKTQEILFDSTLTSMLRKEKWLYDNEGKRVSASQLTRETISNDYNLESQSAIVFLDFLGIKKTSTDINLTKEEQEALHLGRKLIEAGITQAELAEFIIKRAARKQPASEQQDNSPKDEAIFDDDEIDEMLFKLKKGITKKRQSEAKENAKEPELPLEETPEPSVDQDEYSKPSIDLQKKIEKLKEQTEAQIEDLTRIEKLNEIVNDSDPYTYAWFKALLELEYLSSSEANSKGKQISIFFTKVEKEQGTDKTLILRHPNRYIPQSIEDIGDLQIRLYQGDESKSVTVEVVSVKEYTLRAKLKKSVDISDIDLSKVSKVVVDIKNPVFILEELRKAFCQLDFEDDFNLQQNLTEKIRFIFGPPGTGKTTYLASAEIIPLMKKEEDLKVLVLTPTNKAADVLTRRIIEKMGDDDTYYQWLIRFGTTGDADLENISIIVDKNFDIRTKPRNTTITTIARFAYDYFQLKVQDKRLHLKSLKWDYIIIDEASMVTLASIAYVLYQKPEAFFIIAGDPFQIQPITQIEQWKDMNIYDLVQLNKFVDPVTIPHQYEIKNLQKQYRAIPTIGKVFSHFTYNGILEHHRTEAEQKPLNIRGLDFKDLNIIKFPVSKYESIFKPNTLNKSNYQVYSALFTVEFVQHLSKQIEHSHKDKFRIGVICPYKAQATLVEKLLAQQHSDSDKTEVLIGTIHGFQGDECDIIISIFNPPFSISNHPGMFLNKQNILNVSISRARDYLFVLMPDDNTQDVENLYKIKKIERLIHKHSGDRVSVYEAEVVEEIMFGSKTFVYDNSFATSHQSVNVYSKPEKKYEIRCEYSAIDILLKANESN